MAHETENNMHEGNFFDKMDPDKLQDLPKKSIPAIQMKEVDQSMDESQGNHD
jgi:hypothetical protein